jgi:hypothetical protein
VPLIVALCLALPPRSVRAWEAQAGSPPAWKSHWVQSTEPVDMFANADGDASFGQAAANLFFRVDAPVGV